MCTEASSNRPHPEAVPTRPKRVVIIGPVPLCRHRRNRGALQIIFCSRKPRLDNVHRSMAGVYFGTAVMWLWAGITVGNKGLLADTA